MMMMNIKIEDNDESIGSGYISNIYLREWREEIETNWEYGKTQEWDSIGNNNDSLFYCVMTIVWYNE